MTTPPEEPQVPESGSTPPPPPPAAPTPPAATTPNISADSIKEYLKPAEGLDKQSALLGYVIAGIGLLMFIAAFLPWFSYSIEIEGGAGFPGVDQSDSHSGIGDGFSGGFTLVLGLVLVAVGGLRSLRGMFLREGAIATAAIGALTVLLTVLDFGDIDDATDGLNLFGGDGIDAGSSFGLWLTLLLGVAAIGAGAFALVKKK